ncbi:hypothetical protein F3Y22_tig00110718pilonHSYRG00090 [Hibiscus syriacus]|uniref:Pectate lyase N-terminal domain-containing protein n=1 Tax=Hibiscus syriacus TaxID=106335 RepID=A0A6A2ZW60_HIBSY|nr:hypothetical protein F3Y22_tig00110718pilonHSYRG00090 [Hibiscus syriacus]
MQQADEYLQCQTQNLVCGKVITDEQVVELSRQIVAYAAISKHLAEFWRVYTRKEPGKQKIKEIASELAQHDKISETNVYNFRIIVLVRKKLHASSDSGNGEPEARSEDVGTKDQRKKPVHIAEYDGYWRERELQTKENLEKEYNPKPEELTNHLNDRVTTTLMSSVFSKEKGGILFD